eukprot:2168295-Amphidinium_carterae.2
MELDLDEEGSLFAASIQILRSSTLHLSVAISCPSVVTPRNSHQMRACAFVQDIESLRAEVQEAFTARATEGAEKYSAGCLLFFVAELH